MNENQLFTDDRMQELFEYWKDTFNKRSSTVFDEARQKKIAVALRNYGMEKCKKQSKVAHFRLGMRAITHITRNIMTFHLSLGIQIKLKCS